MWSVSMVGLRARLVHLMLTHPAAMLASTDGTKYGLILRSFCSACQCANCVELHSQAWPHGFLFAPH